MKKPLFKFLLVTIIGMTVMSCCDDDKVDKKTQQEIDEKLALYEKENLEREDLEGSIQNSIHIEAEIQDEIKISDELKLNKLETTQTIKDLIDDKFIKSQSRYNLLKIVGHTAKLVDENESSKKYEVELFSYLNDSIKPEIINPGKDGLLSELKITKNMTATLKFFIADGSLKDNQIYHGTVSETSNVIIDEKELDLKKLKKEFKTPKSMKNVELITRVTVTEYVHKKYNKRSRKIKVKEFPLIGSGVSLGTEFYTESSRMERSFKVSIDTTPIEDIIRRLDKK
ncbi:hypothetical protein [Flagellimonas flava]|uniref:Lipoprotein n=1 Tax=Flagellimonas flava TaxID=570519 RepID=A0A1M5IQU5_9FLAO|nr:hypothetical protein [Allomuricauda flava]SHG30687.1 hypothetical protein SAMN04488116_0872 [Allomuricauda flava]